MIPGPFARKTITDITTNDLVYISHDDGEVSIDPAEALVLARELIGHALAINAPEFKCEIDISLRIEA